MEFDKYSKDYRDHVRQSLAVAKADSDLILKIKADTFVSLFQKFLRSENPINSSILDVGCGVGLMDEYWTSTFKKVTGIDISQDSLTTARQNNPSANYLHYDGTMFPFDNGSFNATVAVCVMHHVPPQQWQYFMNEMLRVTKPGGMVVVFEHNPFNPVTRMVVNRCDFDKDAVLINPWRVQVLANNGRAKHLKTRSILYFPWEGSIFRKTERVLGRLPFGGQYYCAFRKLSNE